MKIVKNFSISDKKFISLIESKKKYEFFVARLTHEKNKKIKEKKFFLFDKIKDEPIEEIINYESKFLNLELEKFFKNYLNEKKFKIRCNNLDTKKRIIEISVFFEKEKICFFKGKKRESGTGFEELESFMNISNECFLIRLIRTFLINKGIKYDFLEKEIFIPGNIPSLKNSKQVTRSGAILPSKTVKKYLDYYNFFWCIYEIDFLNFIKNKSKPYNIDFLFIRDSKRKFDYINIAQAPLDLMQSHNWIKDDDALNVKPYFSDFKVDKENCGVIIKLF